MTVVFHLPAGTLASKRLILSVLGIIPFATIECKACVGHGSGLACRFWFFGGNPLPSVQR